MKRNQRDKTSSSKVTRDGEDAIVTNKNKILDIWKEYFQTSLKGEWEGHNIRKKLWEGNPTERSDNGGIGERDKKNK